MAWWSISLFLLSITYLTYRHPPATWTALPQWLQPAKSSIQSKTHEAQQEEPGKRQEKEKKQEAGTKDSVDVKIPEDDEEKTPQAKPASPASPAVQVPVFALDDSHIVGAQHEEEEEEDERDNLPPPMFPAANSAQRAAAPSLTPSSNAMPSPQTPTISSSPSPSLSPSLSPSPSPSPLPSSVPGLMAPPSTPSSGLMAPPPKPSPSGLMPPPRGPPIRTSPSTASSLRVPNTGPLPNRNPSLSPAAQARGGLAPKSLGAPSRIDTPNSRNKVQLSPGHSPLDWATLARSKNLSNVPHFMRVTPSLLKHNNGRKDKQTGLKKDAWSVYQGKVYNITPYLPFHPGGEGELLRSAGKDGTALFNDVHPWVNWEGMMSSCLVGILVSETEETSGLESLD